MHTEADCANAAAVLKDEGKVCEWTAPVYATEDCSDTLDVSYSIKTFDHDATYTALAAATADADATTTFKAHALAAAPDSVTGLDAMVVQWINVGAVDTAAPTTVAADPSAAAGDDDDDEDRFPFIYIIIVVGVVILVILALVVYKNASGVQYGDIESQSPINLRSPSSKQNFEMSAAGADRVSMT